MGLLPEHLLGTESGDVLGMAAEGLWHPHYHKFLVASWHWELHVPTGKLQVDSSCLSQVVICEELVGGTAPSLCLYHCVVGLERAVDVCLAIGQIEGLRPTAQHCPLHGTCGTGTIQTLVDPRDVSHGREPLLQPGRVLDPTRSLTSAGDHTNHCGNPKAQRWAGRLPRRGKSWCLLLTPTAPSILGAGRTKVSQIAEGGN